MKVISFIVFSLCISFVLFAQNNSNYKTTALSFNCNGFNLNSYYGGVGGRLWISEFSVLNASVGGAVSERDYEKTENINSGIEKNKNLNIGIGMENHFSSSGDLSPYLSYRLSFGIDDQYYRSIYNTTEQINKTYSYNLDFGFGAEYWILNRISLSGQHLFNIHYETGQRRTGNTPNENQDIKGFGLYLGTTSIILSIYF